MAKRASIVASWRARVALSAQSCLLLIGTNGPMLIEHSEEDIGILLVRSIVLVALELLCQRYPIVLRERRHGLSQQEHRNETGFLPACSGGA